MTKDEMLTQFRKKRDKIKADINAVLDEGNLPDKRCYPVLRKRSDLVDMFDPLHEYLANGFSAEIMETIRSTIKEEIKMMIADPSAGRKPLPWMVWAQQVGGDAIRKCPWVLVAMFIYFAVTKPQLTDLIIKVIGSN